MESGKTNFDRGQPATAAEFLNVGRHGLAFPIALGVRAAQRRRGGTAFRARGTLGA